MTSVFWVYPFICMCISYLKLPIVKLVAVLKKELIGGSKTSFYAILDNCTCSWRTWQLLYLLDHYIVRHSIYIYLNKLELKLTFIRKNVILVKRSTVDLRSISFSWLEAGKLFRYIDRSILSELCSWSSNLTNFSFYKSQRWMNTLC